MHRAVLYKFLNINFNYRGRLAGVELPPPLLLPPDEDGEEEGNEDPPLLSLMRGRLSRGGSLLRGVSGRP